MSVRALTVRTEELKACPACGGIGFRTVLEAEDFDLGTGKYRIEQCLTCDIRFTNPRPIPADVSLLYSDRTFEALPEGTSMLARLRKTRLQRRLATVASRIPVGQLRCADIGTGDGFFANVAAQMPFCRRMTAVDFFPEPPPGLRSAVATGELDYISQEAFFSSPATYDLVFARFVLEHVANPIEFIAELRRKLAPQAMLVIEVPNWSSFWRRLFGKYYSELSLPAHTFHLEPKDLAKLLSGFTCEVRQDIHGVVLGKSLGNWLHVPVRRTSLVGLASLGIELILDWVVGPPANMTVFAIRQGFDSDATE